MKDAFEITIGKLLPEPWARLCGKPGHGLTDSGWQCGGADEDNTTELKASHLYLTAEPPEVGKVQSPVLGRMRPAMTRSNRAIKLPVHDYASDVLPGGVAGRLSQRIPGRVNGRAIPPAWSRLRLTSRLPRPA
jgi:hypothetical protein